MSGMVKMEPKIASGSNDDPLDLSYSSQEESDLTDDEPALGVKRKSNESVLLASEKSRKKSRGGEFSYRQEGCLLLPDVRKDVTWQRCREELATRLSRTKSSHSLANLAAFLGRLEDFGASWAVIRPTDHGAGRSCGRCAAKGDECIVQVEVSPTTTTALKIVSRCISCMTSQKSCDLIIGRCRTSATKSLPVSRQIDIAVHNSDRATSSTGRSAANGKQRKGSLEASDVQTGTPKTGLLGPAMTKIGDDGVPNAPTENSLAAAKPDATRPNTSCASRDQVLVALGAMRQFSLRMQEILSEARDLEFETELMFERVEEHFDVIQQCHTMSERSADSAKKAADSVKYVERFTKELKGMVLAKVVELSFRMEIMFNMMGDNVGVIQKALR